MQDEYGFDNLRITEISFLGELFLEHRKLVIQAEFRVS